MDYMQNYNNLKRKMHDAEKILENEYDDTKWEETRTITDERMAKTMKDAGVIFHYKDSGTYHPIYDELYVFDRSEQNLILESGWLDKPETMKFKTIDQDDLNEIKRILQSNQWLFKIKNADILGPMMTDGSVQTFYFNNGAIVNLFETCDFGYQNTFEDNKKDREFKEAINQLLGVLKKNNMLEGFFGDEED